MQEMRVQSLGWEDPMEKEMVTYSSIFAWEIPQTEEPGRLQSLGSQSVQHDWTRTHYYSFSSPLEDYWGSSQGVSPTSKKPGMLAGSLFTKP